MGWRSVVEYGLLFDDAGDEEPGVVVCWLCTAVDDYLVRNDF